jgi:predicted nucleic acid-binding protein
VTTDGDTFLDTNVLLAATVPARPEHRRALARIDAGAAQGSLFLSGQVVREYLAVATRPADVNGLGLARADALANVRQFLQRARSLDEDALVRDMLLQLLDAVPCLGKQVHDANIVATMVAHRVPRLLTLNPSDFARFRSWITVASLDRD